MEGLNKSRLIVGLLTLAVVVCAPQPARAVLVGGTNAVIDLGDQIYIPLRLETSGILGQVAGIGPYEHVVGIDPDEEILSPANRTTSGYVIMTADFNISEELTEELHFIEPNSDMPLTLVFEDLDFDPTESLGGKLVFSEMVEILLLDSDGQDVGGAIPLLLDSTSYLNYRQDVDGQGQQVIITNNVTATYEIPLAQMFGSDSSARNDFIEQLNQDKAFALELTLHSRADYSGARRVRIRNTEECLNGSSVTFSVAPEPGTLALLALGGAMMMARRRRQRVSNSVC